MEAKRFSLFSKSSLFVMISSAAAGALLLPLLIPAKILGLLIGLSAGYYFAKMDNKPHAWWEFFPTSFSEVGIIIGGGVTGMFILPLLLPLHLFGAIFGFTASMTVLTSVNNFQQGVEDKQEKKGRFKDKFKKIKEQKEEKVEEAQNVFFLLRVFSVIGGSAKSVLGALGVPVNSPGASSSSTFQK